MPWIPARASASVCPASFVVAAPAGGAQPNRTRRPFPDDVAKALADETNLSVLAEEHDPHDSGIRLIWEAIISISADRLGPTTDRRGDPTRPGPINRPVRPRREVPATILARMLGIHIQVAVQWQKASAGDWAAYAAYAADVRGPIRTLRGPADGRADASTQEILNYVG
jgi:hypothetical protein